MQIKNRREEEPTTVANEQFRRVSDPALVRERGLDQRRPVFVAALGTAMCTPKTGCSAERGSFVISVLRD
jgi:hypothetical protein